MHYLPIVISTCFKLVCYDSSPDHVEGFLYSIKVSLEHDLVCNCVELAGTDVGELELDEEYGL